MTKASVTVGGAANVTVSNDHGKKIDRIPTTNYEIFGQQYGIRSQLDSDYVSELTSYVHHKMIAASDKSPTADSARVAVLAALNIADEYFRCRDGQTTDDKVVKQRVLELVEKLDNAIADVKNGNSD
ncbi:MAG: cell division protein ZapA [Acidobacteriota bacterium]|nr:cell division protein ZapA [Acidobacteriota bacterium]